jgi:hypothetical protein
VILINKNDLTYILPLDAVIKFLEGISQKGLLAQVKLSGEGFMLFLGEALPQDGTVRAIEIELPKEMHILEMRPLLKQQVDLD